MTETPLTPTFQTVTLEADPAAPMNAATKQYVDATPGAGALQKAGGTMTGPLVLNGAPTAPLQPATKAYTDAAQAAAIAGAPVQSALGRTGNVTLTAPDVATALGYTALDAAKVGAVNGVATLDAGGVVPIAQIPPQVGSGRTYLGTWNAATNTPTLVNGVGTTGNFYIATTTGTALGATYNVGDQVAYNGTTWQRVGVFTGYGTMSNQNANLVAITGGAVTADQFSIRNTGTLSFSIIAGDNGEETTIDQFGAIGRKWDVDGNLTMAGSSIAGAGFLLSSDTVVSKGFDLFLKVSSVTLQNLTGLVMVDTYGAIGGIIDASGSSLINQTVISSWPSLIASLGTVDPGVPGTPWINGSFLSIST